MFQDNPLLAQLKQQIHDSKEQVEGVVKSTDKAYGFLECDKKTYFIAPPSMKKVMHGDKIKATIEKQRRQRTSRARSLN
ncbi:exoribonuclease II [Haemophilus influenzae PittHH]|nr:exoribonuclease II [Haemophilus influenzae PittHH]